jgi:hypothetical protein
LTTDAIVEKSGAVNSELSIQSGGQMLEFRRAFTFGSVTVKNWPCLMIPPSGSLSAHPPG